MWRYNDIFGMSYNFFITRSENKTAGITLDDRDCLQSPPPFPPLFVFRFLEYKHLSLALRAFQFVHLFPFYFGAGAIFPYGKIAPVKIILYFLFLLFVP
jgi:hypothetical protein